MRRGALRAHMSLLFNLLYFLSTWFLHSMLPKKRRNPRKTNFEGRRMANLTLGLGKARVKALEATKLQKDTKHYF